MRSVSLKAALVSALLTCSAASFPAQAEEENSYLPPKELIAKAEPKQAKKDAGAAAEARTRTEDGAQVNRRKRVAQQSQRRAPRVARGRAAPNRYATYYFPRFFGGFN